MCALLRVYTRGVMPSALSYRMCALPCEQEAPEAPHLRVVPGHDMQGEFLSRRTGKARKWRKLRGFEMRGCSR